MVEPLLHNRLLVGRCGDADQQFRPGSLQFRGWVAIVGFVPEVLADQNSYACGAEGEGGQHRARDEPARLVEDIVSGEQPFGGGQPDLAPLQEHRGVVQPGVVGRALAPRHQGSYNDGRPTTAASGQILICLEDCLAEAGVEEDIPRRVAGDGHLRQDH